MLTLMLGFVLSGHDSVSFDFFVGCFCCHLHFEVFAISCVKKQHTAVYNDCDYIDRSSEHSSK